MFTILKHTYFTANSSRFGSISGLQNFATNTFIDPSNYKDYTNVGNTFELGRGLNYFKKNTSNITSLGFLLIENVNNTVSISELSDEITSFFNTKPDINASWTSQNSLYWNIFHDSTSDSSSYSNRGWSYDSLNNCGCGNSNTEKMMSVYNNMLWLRDGLNFEILNISSTTKTNNIDYRTIFLKIHLNIHVS